MENKTIKAGISLLSPFVIKTNHGYSGLEIDLWEEIAERLNLKFEYSRAPFDELLNGVKIGTYDIAFSGITINQERENEFDFCHSYLDSRLLIMTRLKNQTNIIAIIKNNFFQELLKIILFFAITIFALSNIIWFFQKNYGIIESSYLHGIVQSIQYIFYSIFNSYFSDITPHQKTGKLLIIITLLLALTISISHIIRIILFFTRKNKIFNPKFIQDLKDKKVATEKKSTSEKLLKSNNIKTKTFKKIDIAFKKLKNGFVDAILYDSLPILYHMKEHPNEFKASPKIEENQEYAIAINSNSGLKDDINNKILEMKEDGFFDFLYKKWFENN